MHQTLTECQGKKGTLIDEQGVLKSTVNGLAILCCYFANILDIKCLQ